MDNEMADREQPPVIFPRKLLKKFILLYKELPCLWDKTCPVYKQKRRRHNAISKLTELVQEYDRTATRVHVLRKIESLRACVRREHKRVQDSRLKAKSPEDMYVPHLWYYDMLSFVFGEDGNNYQMKPPTAAATDNVEDSDDEVADNEVADDEIADDENSTFQHTAPSYFTECNVPKNVVEAPEGSPVSKRFFSYVDDHNNSSKRHCTEIEDEYDAIGINVAAKLRTLPPSMRILSEKLINDVLFQAQTNGLSTSTIISTPDPFK